MKFKKILSIFLSAVLVVITLSFSTCSSFAAVMTTQEEVTNVNNYDTLMKQIQSVIDADNTNK